MFNENLINNYKNYLVEFVRKMPINISQTNGENLPIDINQSGDMQTSDGLAQSFSSGPPSGIPDPPSGGPWRFFLFNGLLVAQSVNGSNRIDWYWNSTGNPPQWVQAPGAEPGGGGVYD